MSYAEVKDKSHHLVSDLEYSTRSKGYTLNFLLALSDRRRSSKLSLSLILAPLVPSDIILVEAPASGALMLRPASGPGNWALTRAGRSFSSYQWLAQMTGVTCFFLMSVVS